jgi:hypothetical protein
MATIHFSSHERLLGKYRMAKWFGGVSLIR